MMEKGEADRGIMRDFGRKAKAIDLLMHEANIPRSAVDHVVLDMCLEAGGNEFDVAIQYLLHAVITRPLGDARTEWILDRYANDASKLIYLASNREVMSDRVNRARGDRNNKRAKRLFESGG